jgi:hypothetical protein
MPVRNPRVGLPWSSQRVHRRAAYCNYMASEQWFDLRERWAADWAARRGAEPRCLICDLEWALCVDLHHRTYDRLGRETDRDLIPLCRTCHGALHRTLESDRSWRRLNRAQATDLIVVALRRKYHKHGARR